MEERLGQGHSVGLKDQIQTWPTPAARDSKGANGPEHLAKERGHHDQLPNAVALWSGLPAPETSTDGPGSSPSGQTSRRLNPAFVEWLMNWPEGWSLPVVRSANGSSLASTPCGPTDSVSLETASSPPRPQPPSPSCGDTLKGGR